MNIADELRYRNELASSHILLAMWMANKYRRRAKEIGISADRDEIESAAMWGLMMASRSYVDAPGRKFENWAGMAIKGELNELIFKKPMRVRVMRRGKVTHRIEIDGEGMFGADDPAFSRMQLYDLLSTLPPMERGVVESLAFARDTLAEVGARLGVCGERVRHIRDKAFEMMRESATPKVAA